MTTLGFHYFPDDDHYRSADLQTWRPQLQALGARWLTLAGSVTRSVPEAFIRGLLEAGIEPIVHIPAAPIRALDRSLMEPLFSTYARWGVRYVALYSEPNTRAAWSPSDWSRPALVERFLDLLLPNLLLQVECGLKPVFPALRAGGDYWDTGFLEASLAGLTRRGHAELLRQLTFAVNLWTFNRPLDWGQGGLRRWPAARPYHTPADGQDQIGFRVIDWHGEIIAARAGEPRPMLCLAGGPRPGDHFDKNHPPVDEARHASCIRSIVEMVAQDQLPRALINVNFWLLAAAPGSLFAGEAWHRPGGGELPAVEALKRRAAEQARAAQAEAGAARKRAGGERPFRHYLLLPTFEWGVSEWHWGAALDFVKTHQPVCGFSPDEARQAERVTIFGNEQGIGRDVELALAEAGCVVDRIALNGMSK